MDGGLGRARVGVRRLPRREGVASDPAAREVVRIFTDTLTFANLLVNGVVMSVAEHLNIELADATDLKKMPIASPASGSNESNTSARTNMASTSFVFDFQGGIQLIVPRTPITSDAIADGGLKAVRKALADFAKKVGPEESVIS